MKVLKIVLSILAIFLVLLLLQYYVQSKNTFRFIFDENEIEQVLTNLGAKDVTITPASLITFTLKAGKAPLDSMQDEITLFPGATLDDVVEAPTGQTLHASMTRNEDGILLCVFSSGMQQLLRTPSQERIFSLQNAARQIVLQLINGVTLGGVYAMIAVGYTLVYGIMFMINFAHGEIFMFGAYGAYFVFYWLTSSQTLPNSWMVLFLWLFIAAILVSASVGIVGLTTRVFSNSPLLQSHRNKRLILLAFLGAIIISLGLGIFAFYGLTSSRRLLSMWIIAFLSAFAIAMATSAGLGVLVERAAYRPLRQAPRLTLLISAIGASIFLQNVMMLITKGRIKYYPNEALVNGSIPLFGGLSIEIVGLMIIIISILMMMGLYTIIQKTKTGKAIRAVAEDKATASLMGVNVNRVVMLTFLLGSSMAGAGGIMVGLRDTQINHMMGFLPGMKAFTAAVLGGIGNIPGAMFGGYFLGVAEALGAQFMPAEYKNVIAFSLLIIVLLFKPTGFMGEVLAKKKM